MLVGNKFIYVNLPRCGSTSFHYSCMLNGLELKNLNSEWQNINSKIDFKDIDETKIMDFIQHGHEQLPLLRKEFGDHHPVIAVKRDRHSTFYSLYKHVVFDLRRAFAMKACIFFKNCSLDELFFFKTEDLYSYENRISIINDFLLKNKLIKKYSRPEEVINLYSDEYIVNILNILITPASYWHNHDKDIIWFDINKLDIFYNRGVRYMTLTWNNSPSWASSHSDEKDPKYTGKKGLSTFGKEVIARMNKLGIIVDISHVGETTFWDAIKTTTKPVIASHSNAYTICPVTRNLKDDQIKAIGKNGGVIHLNFFSAFVDSTFQAKNMAFRRKHKTELDALLATGIQQEYAQSTLAEKYKVLQGPLKQRPSIVLIIQHLPGCTLVK